MSPWRLGLVAALAGAVWASAFTATPRLVLPWLALAPFFWALDRAHDSFFGRFGIGLAHGVGFWIASVSWIAPTVETFGGVAKPLSWLALVAASLILGVWHAVFAVLTRPWLGRDARDTTRSLAPLVAVSAAWVVSEWMRGHVPAFAFPWNLAGYAWIDVPGALALSAWIGSFGLSFLLVLANVGIALAVSRRRPMLAVMGVLTPIVLLALAFTFGGVDDDATHDALEVALIQPGGRLLGNETDNATSFARLLEESRDVCRADGVSRLLVWPESAAYPYGWETSAWLREEIGALAARGCRVVINAPLRATVDDGRGGYENAALLVGPDGVLDTYAKQRLVPFGEYVPLAGLLPMLGPLARIDEAFRPGERGSLLANERGDQDIDLGMAICYEVTFPGLVARGVREGAGVLVTITNDAWYGDSTAPHQHLRAARFRAAETGRPLVRAALTGVSAVVDPNGRVTDHLDVGAVGRIEATVHPRAGRTPFVRASWLVPATSLFMLLTLGMIQRRRAR